VVANAGAELAPASHLLKIDDGSGQEYLVSGARTLGNSGAFAPQPRYSASLGLNVKIYDFGRAAALRSAAQAGAEATVAESLVARAAVLNEVRQAYASWLLAVGRRDLARRDASEAEQLRRWIDGRIEVGAASEADGADAQVEEATAALALEQAQAAVQLARFDLEQASATRLLEAAEPDESLLTLAAPRTHPSSAPPRAQAFEQRRRAFEANAEAERALGWPLVTGGVETGVRGQADALFPVYRAGVALSMPIWDAGASRAAAERALAQASEASALAQEARAEDALRWDRARVMLQSSEAAVVLASRLSVVASHALEKAQERQTLQPDHVRELIVARQRRTRADLALLEARVERLRTVLGLTAETSGS
jgi:outer membrane protein TolC